MTERFGMAVNLKVIAPTQYTNFNFNSMTMFNGNPIAVSETGIFSLEDAETDNGVEIDATMELVTTDCGIFNSKRFRRLHVGLETSGDIRFTVGADGGGTRTHTLTPDKTGQAQHRTWVNMSRSQHGMYWDFKIENVEGCDFSIDHIQGIPIILSKSRR